MNNDESNEYLFDTIRLQAISKLLGQLDTSMIDAFEQSQQLLSKLNNAVEKLVDDIKELPNNSEGYRELKEVMK